MKLLVILPSAFILLFSSMLSRSSSAAKPLDSNQQEHGSFKDEKKRSLRRMKSSKSYSKKGTKLPKAKSSHSFKEGGAKLPKACKGVDTTYKPEIIAPSVDIEDPVSLAAATRCGAALIASGFNFFDFGNYGQWFDEDSILYLPETGYYKGPQDISEYVQFTISDMFEYYYDSMPGSPLPLVADGDTCVISFATTNSMAVKEMYSSIEDNPSADAIVGFRVSFNITSPDLSTVNIDNIAIHYPPGYIEFLFDGILGGESVARRNCMILESACSDTFYNKNGYGEVEECVSDLMALPRSDGDNLDGNTLKCRTLHADFAAENDKHCPHISILPEYDEKCFLKCQESANNSIEDAFHPVELAFFKSVAIAVGLGETQFVSPTIFGPPSS